MDFCGFSPGNGPFWIFLLEIRKNIGIVGAFEIDISQVGASMFQAWGLPIRIL